MMARNLRANGHTLVGVQESSGTRFPSSPLDLDPIKDPINNLQLVTDPLSTTNATADPYFNYRQLIGEISQKLHRENALRLAHLFDLPSWYFEVGPSHDPSYALRVLIALEGKAVYHPGNIRGLVDALKNVEREDLCLLSNEFIKKTAEPVWDCGSRRQTHPQNTPARPAVTSTILTPSGKRTHRHSFGLPRPPVLHSSSMSSIAGDMFLDNETDTVLRSRSKPDLHAESLNTNDLSTASDHVQSVQPSNISLGLDFALMNSQMLQKQILYLKALANNSSQNKSTIFIIKEAFTAASQVTNFLTHAKEESGTPPDDLLTNSRAMSRASSTGVPVTASSPLTVSLQSSGIVALAAASSSVGVVEEQLNSDSTTKADKRSKRSRKRSSYIAACVPSPTDQPLTAPHPERMHTTTPPAPSRLIRRRYGGSRREEKKLCRKGVLIWQLKVKKLKLWQTQQEVRHESEDFFDNTKRRFKAILHPYGIGEDAGTHMTLGINCLDEPKSKSIAPTDIIIKVLDPLSDSTNPVILPIKRSLERRGIRFVQQFISHKQINNFNSAIIIVTIVIAETAEDSEESDSIETLA